MKTQGTGIVLLHGAGLGGWIYNEVIPHLSHPSLAIDFPNREDSEKKNKSLTFQDYYQPVVEKIKNWNKEQIIIVSHSIGGIVGLKVAEQLSNRLAGFVGISAAVPAIGQSFISCLPFPKNIIMGIITRVVGTKPPASAIEKGYCNGLSKTQCEKVIKNFTAESQQLFLERIDAKIPDTKKLYIKTTADNEFPPALQETFAKRLKAQVVTIDSGHLPMLSRPTELAAIINKFA